MSTTSNLLWRQVRDRLTDSYPPEEAASIAKWLLAARLQRPSAAILAGYPVTAEQAADIQTDLHRLLAHEPLQYVIGETSFGGHTWRVGPGVLIPRPETEEMLEQLIRRHPEGFESIADLGTGSGCIAITLALAMPKATVHALDLSSDALHIARQNAQRLGATIQFEQGDMLTDWPAHWPPTDLLISNPPYVTESERHHMRPNVLDYEPPMALFVPDTDPLRFYTRLAQLSHTALRPGGWLYAEINEQFGPQVQALWQQAGLTHTQIGQDFLGKDRWVAGQKPAQA